MPNVLTLGIFRSLSTRLLLALSFLPLLWLASAQLTDNARFGNLFALAERIESGDQIDPNVIARYRYLIEEVISGGHCRSEILMAGATVTLADLDNNKASILSSEWINAAAAVEAYLKHVTACAPLNANFWLRLAMVSDALGRPAERVAEEMILAQALAPAEQDLIIARLYAWNRMDASILRLAHHAVEADLRNGLLAANPALVAPALLPISKSLLPMLQAAIDDVTPARALELRRNGFEVGR